MKKHNSSMTSLGIDIGGTKISVIIGHPKKGKIIAKEKFLLPIESPEKTIERIQLTYEKLLKQCKITADEIDIVAIGCPGSCDYTSGRAINFPNMPLWRGYDIKKAFQKFIKHKPIIFDNDANCAAMAEKYFGTGKKISDFLYITVSTGVGAGLIINNKLYRGISLDAAEFGHMTIVKNGEQCGCGKKGCLEAYASGTSLARRAGVKDVPELLKEMRKGNTHAQLVFDEGIHALAIGIGNTLQLLNLEAVIIGGGVSTIGESYFQKIRKAAKEYTWPRPYDHCTIMQTSLLDDVVDYGTMALALSF